MKNKCKKNYKTCSRSSLAVQLKLSHSNKNTLHFLRFFFQSHLSSLKKKKGSAVSPRTFKRNPRRGRPRPAPPELGAGGAVAVMAAPLPGSGATSSPRLLTSFIFQLFTGFPPPPPSARAANTVRGERRRYLFVCKLPKAFGFRRDCCISRCQWGTREPVCVRACVCEGRGLGGGRARGNELCSANMNF